MPKPIQSGPEFEAAFPVKGRILQAILCECEEEGDIRIRVSRRPEETWNYDPKDASTYVDLHAYDPRGTYAKVRAGEWAEGRIVAYGFLKKVWANRIEIPAGVIGSGSRLVGAVHMDDSVEIDFGLFRAKLAFEDAATRRKVVRDAGFRDGAFVATDVGLDIELKRWGPKESILRKG
ncbi:MAG TPA: hypothetical protein VIB49_08075 [Thermoplasmata archaeon]